MSPRTGTRPTATGSLSRTTSTTFQVSQEWSIAPLCPRISLLCARLPAWCCAARRIATAASLARDCRQHDAELTRHRQTSWPSTPAATRSSSGFAGKNATKAFWKYHSESVLKRYGAKYKIGEVGEAAKL